MNSQMHSDFALRIANILLKISIALEGRVELNFSFTELNVYWSLSIFSLYPMLECG